MKHKKKLQKRSAIIKTINLNDSKNDDKETYLEKFEARAVRAKTQKLKLISKRTNGYLKILFCFYIMTYIIS